MAPPPPSPDPLQGPGGSTARPGGAPPGGAAGSGRGTVGPSGARPDRVAGGSTAHLGGAPPGGATGTDRGTVGPPGARPDLVVGGSTAHLDGAPPGGATGTDRGAGEAPGEGAGRAEPPQPPPVSGDLARFRVTFDAASWTRYWDAVRRGLLRRDEIVGVQFLLWPAWARDPASPLLPPRSRCLVGASFGFQFLTQPGVTQEPAPGGGTPPAGYEERLAHYPRGLAPCAGGYARDAFGPALVDLRFWHREGTSPDWSPDSDFTPVDAAVTLHVRSGPSGITNYIQLPADLEFGFTYVGFDGAEGWPGQGGVDPDTLLRHSTPILSGRLRLEPGPADLDKVYV